MEFQNNFIIYCKFSHAWNFLQNFGIGSDLQVSWCEIIELQFTNTKYVAIHKNMLLKGSGFWFII